MANDRTPGFLPNGSRTLGHRLRSGSAPLWRVAPNDASIPYTPVSSRADPRFEHALRESVEESMLRRDFLEAQRRVGESLAGGRYLDTALHLLGVVRLFQGDASSAGDCLQRALELRADSAERERRVSTRNALARVAMYREEYEDAWEQLDQALALEPFSLHLHWNRLCLARDQLARGATDDLLVRERLDTAQRAMESIDPEWRDEATANPYLVSLK